MKMDIKTTGFLILILSLCTSLNTQAQQIHKFKSPLAKENRTVLDLLKSFVGSKVTASLHFSVKDIKNGYLRFSRQPVEDIYDETFVLFKGLNGDDIIAYSFVSCGPVCGQEINFFSIQNKAFKNINRKVISKKIRDTLNNEINTAEQKMDYPEALFELPRYGKTINIWLANDGEKTSKLLMQLSWDGQKFNKLN